MVLLYETLKFDFFPLETCSNISLEISFASKWRKLFIVHCEANWKKKTSQRQTTATVERFSWDGATRCGDMLTRFKLTYYIVNKPYLAISYFWTYDRQINFFLYTMETHVETLRVTLPTMVWYLNVRGQLDWLIKRVYYSLKKTQFIQENRCKVKKILNRLNNLVFYESCLKFIRIKYCIIQTKCRNFCWRVFHFYTTQPNCLTFS